MLHNTNFCIQFSNNIEVYEEPVPRTNNLIHDLELYAKMCTGDLLDSLNSMKVLLHWEIISTELYCKLLNYRTVVM